MLDTLILNRNLADVTNVLVEQTRSFAPKDSFVGVIDSGSRPEEISPHTVVRDHTLEARIRGLRINRGYNLGIEWWLSNRKDVEWLLLMPNDSEVVSWSNLEFRASAESYNRVGAIFPIPPKSGYEEALGTRNHGLVWNLQEGPIALNRRFCESLVGPTSSVFDPDNFRGYLAFLELSLRCYAKNFAIVGTNALKFSEREDYLLSMYHLIGTEEVSENFRLLVQEGNEWLKTKYGFDSRWELENMVRLAFEEFIRTNPEVELKEIV